MNKPTVYDCSTIIIDPVKSRSGSISVIQNQDHFPFDVKRIFYLYDIPGGESRGAHA